MTCRTAPLLVTYAFVPFARFDDRMKVCGVELAELEQIDSGTVIQWQYRNVDRVNFYYFYHDNS